MAALQFAHDQAKKKAQAAAKKAPAAPVVETPTEPTPAPHADGDDDEGGLLGRLVDCALFYKHSSSYSTYK